MDSRHKVVVFVAGTLLVGVMLFVSWENLLQSNLFLEKKPTSTRLGHPESNDNTAMSSPRQVPALLPPPLC